MGPWGTGISTVSGWILSLITIFIYLTLLNRKNKTWISFKHFIRDAHVNWHTVLPIIAIGLSMFLIDFTFSISSICYIAVLSSLTKTIGGHSINYYLPTLGMTSTISNLIIIGSSGIIEGGRIIISYNHQLKKHENIKKTCFFLYLVSLMYSAITFLTFGIGLNHAFIKLFDINSDAVVFARYYLIIQISLIFLFSLQNPSICLFQSTNRILLANIASTIQYGLIFYICLGSLYAIGRTSNSAWPLFLIYLTSALVTAILLIILTWYILNKKKRKLNKS